MDMQDHRHPHLAHSGHGQPLMQSALYVVLALAAIFVALLPALLH
jgi:hypothetical protein